MSYLIAEVGAIALLLGLASWEGVVLSYQTRHRNRKYLAARTHAMAVGKPLLVAGGPLGVTWFRQLFRVPAHGHGDICFDIDCRALTGASCGVIADIRNIPFSDKSFGAVFVSHLLEHLPSVLDAKQALAELNRVADAVFITYPFRQSFYAWLIPDHHLWLWQKENKIYLKQRNGFRKKDKEEAAVYMPTRRKSKRK